VLGHELDSGTRYGECQLHIPTILAPKGRSPWHPFSIRLNEPRASPNAVAKRKILVPARNQSCVSHFADSATQPTSPGLLLKLSYETSAQ